MSLNFHYIVDIVVVKIHIKFHNQIQYTLQVIDNQKYTKHKNWFY